MSGTAGTRGVLSRLLALRRMFAMIPPVLITLLAQRDIVRRLTMGAVRA